MNVFAAKRSLFAVLLGLALAGSAVGAAAQTTTAVAPTVIPVSGQILTPQGQPRTGPVLLVISLYEGQSDPAPRWVEHQPVTLDAQGRYSVQFGSTQTEGLPADLFTGAASTRWLGVAIENEPEQPRVMLLSVPYAAKAASAETLAGRTASDFVLASTFKDDVRAAIEDDRETTSGSGTVGTQAVTANYLQKGDGAGATTDSTVFEVGGSVGVGTTAPSAPLHIVGVDNTVGAFPEVIIADSTPVASNVGGGFGFQGKYNGGLYATFAAVKGGKDNGTAGSYTGYLSLWTQSGALTERMRITSDGRFGLGTTAPNAPVHIVGVDNTAGAYPEVLISDSSAMNANVGGGFGFQGRYTTGGAYATLGAVKSGKDNAISGNYTGYLSFWTQAGALTERLRITSGGNVGIGTTAPTAKLHVVGDTLITGNVIVDGNIGAKYQDVAEWVDAAEPLEAGSLVMIDPTTTNRVLAASAAYATSVAGAVSAQPGLVLGEGGEGRVLVAQSGRVKVKADARFGAIKPGDLLVSSPTKGHLMKSKPVKMGDTFVHRPGTLVGKALEALPSGRGEILVLLTLQ